MLTVIALCFIGAGAQILGVVGALRLVREGGATPPPPRILPAPGRTPREFSTGEWPIVGDP